MFSVAIVGLGRIGAKYGDWHIEDALSQPQRNHVDAIAYTKGVHLTTGVDSDLAVISQCVQDPRFARARPSYHRLMICQVRLTSFPYARRLQRV